MLTARKGTYLVISVLTTLAK